MSAGRPPDFDELVGEGLDPAERERLRRVHDLLVQAGPPPELPPALADVDAEPAAPVYPLFPRRRWAAAAALAAALALAAFGVGYLVGDRGASAAPETFTVLPMAAPDGSATPRASLVVFEDDDAGNWPMELTARGLPELPDGGTYTLWLTRAGRLAQSCGEFAAAGEKTVVPLNAPFRLRDFDGWVITRTGSREVVVETKRAPE